MQKIFSASLNFDPKIIESSDLIVFNEKYKKNLEELKIVIRESQDEKPLKLFFKRITQRGYELKEKELFVKKIMNNGFFYLLKGNPPLDENEKLPFARWDNVLGEVPVLPQNKDLSIFTTSCNFKSIKQFFEQQVCIPLRNFEGIDCTIHLQFTYTKGSTFYGHRFESIGHFKKANWSNVEYFHIHTFATQNEHGKYDYVDLNPRNEVDRYIAPDRILTGIRLENGLIKINPHDDEE